MSSYWTVEPETTRVDLAYGGRAFWVDLKKELTAGEAARLDAAGFMRGHQATRAVADPDEAKAEISVDWSTLTLAKVKTWLAGWSLADESGARLPISLDTLRALRAPVFRLIEQAVDRHAREVAQAEKQFQTGSVMTSASISA
jgi:hypothetical protein